MQSRKLTLVIAAAVYLATALTAVSAKDSPADHLAINAARAQEVAAESVLACKMQSPRTIRTFHQSAIYVGSIRLAGLVRARRIPMALAERAAATWLNPGAIAEIQAIFAKQSASRLCSTSALNAHLASLMGGVKLLREKEPMLRIPATDHFSFIKRRAEACVMWAWASRGLNHKPNDKPSHVARVAHYVLRTCRDDVVQYETAIRLNPGESNAKARYAAYQYLHSPHAVWEVFHWANAATSWMLN